MIVYSEGKVIASSSESFDDKEGNKVEYFINVVKTQGGLMTVNSKHDFSNNEGVVGVLVFKVTEDAEKKNRFKVSLVELRSDETLNLPEAEID